MKFSKNRDSDQYSFNKKDLEKFKQGEHYALYDKLGAHCVDEGVYFNVWAPNADAISVICNFNQGHCQQEILTRNHHAPDIWEGFVEGIKVNDRYKFSVESCGKCVDKIDPFGLYFEQYPQTATFVFKSNYQWGDDIWLQKRDQFDCNSEPVSIYELHLGSWFNNYREINNKINSYYEIGAKLIPYLKNMGFTHLELMPLVEHPYYPSWGYQGIGFFAPSSRYGSPDDFRQFIDLCHHNDISVILDWVPAHFPKDKYGLINYDGTPLFEKRDVFSQWGTCLFDVGKNEVTSFLISSAMFWCKEFHIDGLRVDAVTSMLYLDDNDFEKRNGNIVDKDKSNESIAFLRRLNVELKISFPDVIMIAEESSSWSKVSKNAKCGGLHFDMKWNMTWIHEMIDYFYRMTRLETDDNEGLTFSARRMFQEKFIIALSHDEVVGGKGSLLSKMPGNDCERFVYLKLLYGYMFLCSAKKLIFMGGDIASAEEWNHDQVIAWDVLKNDKNKGVQRWLKDLNRLYCREKAMYENDFSGDGFTWVMDSYKDGIVVFIRNANDFKDKILVVGSFQRKCLEGYRLGVSAKGGWREILNSNDKNYDGQGIDSYVMLKTEEVPWHNQRYSVLLTIQPLRFRLFKYCDD